MLNLGSCFSCPLWCGVSVVAISFVVDGSICNLPLRSDIAMLSPSLLCIHMHMMLLFVFEPCRHEEEAMKYCFTRTKQQGPEAANGGINNNVRCFCTLQVLFWHVLRCLSGEDSYLCEE